MPSLYVGIMSGTSLDGADAILVDFASHPPRTLAFATVAFEDETHARLLRLSAPGSDHLDDAAEASRELATTYAAAATAALREAGVSRGDVAAIGCHGQTVRHRPERHFTIQLNDAALLAELTGIDVVADFRRRDMAAGGQGAPLVPAFHEAVFRHAQVNRAVVNVGGISNITSLPAAGGILGFDCGPGNMLMDIWCQERMGERFDADGRWAATGTLDEPLLERLLEEPYLRLPPPKSTGRELFSTGWLRERLRGDERPEDVQATLAEYTAATIVDALDRYCAGTEEIFVAGGGARNRELMRRIQQRAGTRRVAPSDAAGVPSGHVEAMAFAWYAMKCLNREAVNLSAVTGASGPRILGAIYPA